jgi:DNA polymerase-3 subunit beta
MKVSFERETLLSAFQTASAVVPSRSTKPILQNVKLEARDETAVLIATDLEIGVRAEVGGVVVDRPGSTVLPTARFGSILRESTDALLRLECDAEGTVVRGERSEFRLLAENPDEFPTVASFNEASYHALPARSLREIIRRTAFATDTESTRYALSGVLIELTENNMTAVGTDGRRLAMMSVPARAVGGHGTGNMTTIIPARAMHLMERSLVEPEAEVRLAVKGNAIILKSDRTTIYSRLVEGRFPKWREVFPKRENVLSIELAVGPLHAAVRQAAILTSDESRGVEFTFAGGKLTLSGRAAQLGQSRVELPIAYQGRDLSITLDPRFVIDFLKVLDPAKSFTMELKDAESAAVCSTDDGYGYVIMPLAR